MDKNFVLISGCVYNGKSYTVGAIFLAADECNICTCKGGTVECTNSTGCGQGSGTLCLKNFKRFIAVL